MHERQRASVLSCELWLCRTEADWRDKKKARFADVWERCVTDQGESGGGLHSPWARLCALGGQNKGRKGNIFVGICALRGHWPAMLGWGTGGWGVGWLSSAAQFTTPRIQLMGWFRGCSSIVDGERILNRLEQPIRQLGRHELVGLVLQGSRRQVSR